MYRFTGFSPKADAALNTSVTIACELGHTYVGSEHLLAALTKDTTSVAGILLGTRHITFLQVQEKLKMTVGCGIPTRLTQEDFSPRLRKISENALILAKKDKGDADTAHLLTAMLRQPKCAAGEILVQLGVKISPLLSQAEKNSCGFVRSLPDTGKTGKPFINEKSGGTLEKYGTDLTAKVREGKIDPVVCREKEIERLIRILCRRTKNNPCLLGEPGVGKTALAEGLAARIAAGDVPENLCRKRLIAVSLNSMVAGAKYRGDFEERIKNLTEEAVKSGDVILFIDEIHNLVGAGSAEGAVDAANILKPELARGQLRLIGATTTDEYRKTIQKDKALDRRFQTLVLSQPTEEEAVTMLKVLQPLYEQHHNCLFDNEAITSAVELSSRYITGRCLPDKALDVLDEAAALVTVRSHISGESKAAYLPVKVEKEDICEIVSEQSRIPLQRIKAGNTEVLQNLRSALLQSVIGQEKAVDTVMNAVCRMMSGIHTPNRPMGVFLFCGASGVGKTLLAKTVARYIFGSDDALMRFDMGEYTEKQSVSRLIGSPPGYVGFEESGMLIKCLEDRPYSLLLFDEIEKADISLLYLFLRMTEEGEITAADGKKVNCRHAMIVFTSNAGAGFLQNGQIATGFMTGDKEKEPVTKAEKEVEKCFPPEFINRLDATVFFENPSREDLIKIAEKELKGLGERVHSLGCSLEFSSDVSVFIAENCKNLKGGARNIGRMIEKEIEVPLSVLLTAPEKSRYIRFHVIGNRITPEQKQPVRV